MENTNNHGGARAGAGRKRLSPSGQVKVQFSLQQEEVDLIEILSAKENLNKSRFIASCIKFWQENHRISL